jgi:hypothetical protein
MKPTQKEIYDCAVKRGKIGLNTTRKQFLDAIASELLELAEAQDTPQERSELADIVLICYSYAEHHLFDLKQQIDKKHKYNLTRKD